MRRTLTMGTDKEEADDLVAQMNEAQRILDIHSEDELVKRTGKYPGDYLKAGASEIAALRRQIETMQRQLDNHNQDSARRSGDMIRLKDAHPDWPEECRKGIVNLLFDNDALRSRVAQLETAILEVC